MGVTIIPNYGEDIGKALANIGGGLANIINPNAEFQRAFEKAVLTNPQLRQQLADLEHQTPGSVLQTYGKYLKPATAKAIAETPASLQSVQETGLMKAIDKMSPAEVQDYFTARAQGYPTSEAYHEAQGREQARGKTLGQIVGTGGEPTLGTIESVRGITGATPDQLRGEQFRLEQERLAMPDAMLHSELSRTALDFYHDSSPKDRTQMAAYASIPGLMANDHFLMEQARMREVFDARTSDRQADAIERLNIAHANRAWDITGVGQPQDWYKYMTDPVTFNRARDLASGKIVPVSEEDHTLLEMAHSIDMVQGGKRALQVKGWINQINSAMVHLEGSNNIKPATDESRPLYINLMNQALQQMQNYGMPALKAEWESRSILRGQFGRDRVKITDAAGQEVPREILQSWPLDPGSANPQAVAAALGSDSTAIKAWNAIVSAGDIPGGLRTLSQMESQRRTPLANSVTYKIIQAINAAIPAAPQADTTGVNP